MPLVAPTEPKPMHVLGKLSSLPERHGADVLLHVAGGVGWVGVQRKEMSDLVASVNDGRLAKEVQQMRAGFLSRAVLVVEGRPKWTLDGALVSGFTNWTRDQHLALLFSVQAEGVWVGGTDDVAGTVSYVRALDGWLRKSKHTALVRRPGPVSMWGKPTNEDYARHLVMGLPNVGPELARRIVEKFGIPFRWKVGVEDLMTVEGIGKKKAESIWGCMTDE